ncbi:zinc ribbon domain-containing protein [Candidatus Pacearchaeota archaeon]|nr:zinc ribbon domain-containing protein [Candidatus Pacearchaeota archaeon]
MFKQKCTNCGKKISKKYEFCPHCGANSRAGKLSDENDKDFGFLGRDDIKEFDNLGMQLPFGFKMLMKPLLKELTKQMSDLDREVRKDGREINKKSIPNERTFTRFDITIGMPGQKPIKIVGTGGNFAKIGSMQGIQNIQPSKQFKLPKIDQDVLKRAKNFPRKEPQTDVRRLADRVVYEISMPGVKSEKNINIANFEEALEIKAVSDKEVFTKNLKMKMPLLGYSFADEKLILEFAAR